MAKYLVDSSFWDDDKVVQLTDGAGNSNLLQYVILQALLTGPQRSGIPGLQRASAQSLAEVIRQPPDAVRAALDDLCERFPSLVQQDPQLRVVRLPNAPKYNTHRGPLNVKAWFRAWKHLPESRLKYDHIPSLMGAVDLSSVPTCNAWNAGFGTVENGRYFADLDGPSPDSGHLQHTPSDTPSDRVSDTPSDTPSDRVSDTPSDTPSDRVSDTPSSSAGAGTGPVRPETGLFEDTNNVVDLQARARDSVHLQNRVSDTIDALRDQRSEIRDQRSEIRDQRSEIRDQRSGIPPDPIPPASDSPRQLVEQRRLRLPTRSRDDNPTCDVHTYVAEYAGALRDAGCFQQLGLDPTQVTEALDAMVGKCHGFKRVASWDKTAGNYLATQAENDRQKYEATRRPRSRTTRSAPSGANGAAPPHRRSPLGDLVRSKGRSRS